MAGLTTNPVYVVDLGFLLPVMVITGILLLRRHSTGFLLTPGMLIFGAVFPPQRASMTCTFSGSTMRAIPYGQEAAS